MEGQVSLDPWGASNVGDYSRLFNLFGIEPIDRIIDQIPSPNRYIRRRIDFGHRDLQRVLKAVADGTPYAVMSGIKPTGVFHLGSRMTAEKMIYFQHLSPKATVFYSIADVEAYCDNGLSFARSEKIAIQNVADLLALGLDPKRAIVYKQSEATAVMDLAFIFSRGVTMNMMEAIYGSRPFGLYLSALVQAGDILLPQLKAFGGPKPVLVPVGADQDPHIRLSRDLAHRYHKEMGFVPPSAIYHKLFRSLTGESKMSKRDPMSILTLADDPKIAHKKVMNCLTGGRDTIAEQRKLGGQPDRCVAYELYQYHFVDSDDRVGKVWRECVNGERVCGDCKAEIADEVSSHLKEHQRKNVSMIDKAVDLIKESRERMPDKP